jgi:hypothetical protein
MGCQCFDEYIFLQFVKLCEHQAMMYNRYLHCRNYGMLHAAEEAKAITSKIGTTSTPDNRSVRDSVSTLGRGGDDSASVLGGGSVVGSVTGAGGAATATTYRRHSMYNLVGTDNSAVNGSPETKGVPMVISNTRPSFYVANNANTKPTAAASLFQSVPAPAPAPAPSVGLTDYNIRINNAAALDRPVNRQTIHRRDSMRSRDIVKFDLDDMPDDILGMDMQRSPAPAVMNTTTANITSQQRQSHSHVNHNNQHDDDDNETVSTLDHRTASVRSKSVVAGGGPRTNKAAVLRRASTIKDFVPLPTVEAFGSTTLFNVAFVP